MGGHQSLISVRTTHNYEEIKSNRLYYRNKIDQVDHDEPYYYHHQTVIFCSDLITSYFIRLDKIRIGQIDDGHDGPWIRLFRGEWIPHTILIKNIFWCIQRNLRRSNLIFITISPFFNSQLLWLLSNSFHMVNHLVKPDTKE